MQVENAQFPLIDATAIIVLIRFSFQAFPKCFLNYGKYCNDYLKFPIKLSVWLILEILLCLVIFGGKK